MRLIQDPGEGPLDDPALGQHDEAVRIAALDDLQAPAAGAGNGLCHLRSLIAGIGEDAFDKGERSSRPAQQFEGTVAVLDVGGMNDHAQQEAERIDENVTLASADLLARIEALRVNRAAPF